jgi:multiple sugar transport system substrate-binding protein
MPTQNGGNPATVTMCGGWSWAVSEFSENKDLAFEFLAFCGNKENAARRSLLDGRMCPRDDAGEVEGYADRAYVEEMTAFMANAYVRPKSEDYALVTTEIQRLVEMVANDSFTPEQAAAEYATNVKNIVGEENTITK